jgi:hypothetical protein
MFGRFLREASVLAKENRLESSANEFLQIGNSWDQLGELFRHLSEQSDPASHLAECKAPLLELAEREKAAWSKLAEIIN